MSAARSGHITLEICLTSRDHAIAAERAGADRIELCANLAAGGATPSPELMRKARTSVRVPIYAMIRPRPGNFVSSAEEFAAMRNDIRSAQLSGMDGVVLGILTPSSDVDTERTRELVDLAHPLPVTFHRAFDEVRDFGVALEAVIATGAQRILTSGGQPQAVDALAQLKQLVQQAGSRISIMPGSGVHAGNVVQVLQQTGAREVHASLGLSRRALQKISDPQAESATEEARYLAEWEDELRKLKAAL